MLTYIITEPDGEVVMKRKYTDWQA